MHLVCKIHQEIESDQVQEQNMQIASYRVLTVSYTAGHFQYTSVSNPFKTSCLLSNVYKFQGFL